jgi:hypothetical protein
MPSAKGSWFISFVRSRNGSTAMDFCGCEATAGEAEGLLFAILPWNRKAQREITTSAMPSAVPAAHL